MAGAIALGFAFWVDQLFTGIEVALVQLGPGLIVGAGLMLHGSIVLSFFVYWLIVMINTLAEGKYAAYPGAAIAIGDVFCLIVLAVLLPRFCWRAR